MGEGCGLELGRLRFGGWLVGRAGGWIKALDAWRCRRINYRMPDLPPTSALGELATGTALGDGDVGDSKSSS